MSLGLMFWKSLRSALICLASVSVSCYYYAWLATTDLLGLVAVLVGYYFAVVHVPLQNRVHDELFGDGVAGKLPSELVHVSQSDILAYAT